MKKKYIFLIHFFFWFYIINQALFPLYIRKLEWSFLNITVIKIILFIINFYIFYFWLLPILFKTRNKIISVIIGFGVAILFGFFRVGAYYLIQKYIILFPETELEIKDWEIYGEIVQAIVASIYALLLKFTVDWFQNQKQKSELINQNQASELALLRSQVNPHFLFNTLNNIYSLVYQKSDVAPDAVMKLSSIMRYMLYDANSDKVPLRKEIEYLNSFIELQKLRIKRKDFVEINIIGEVEDQPIVPMILIPFVENAFKHGNKKADSPGIIINIQIIKEKITYEIISYLAKEIANKDNTGGIGLSNTKRRLELLYPKNHKLEIAQTVDKYIVKLEIYI
jgi:two-component system, LytTR family, sensor kinase